MTRSRYLSIALCMFAMGCGGGSSPTPVSPTPAATIAPTFALSGTITDVATTRALSGVRITVDGSAASATTDAIGGYTIPGLPSGATTARASASGYDSASKAVTIASGARADFQLLTAGSFTGTWRGTARSTSCSDGNAVEGFCRTNPTASGTVVAKLTQTGNNVTGLVTFAQDDIRVQGLVHDGVLNVDGQAPSQSLTVAVENWSTRILGSSLSGGFTWRLTTTSAGSVRYVMNLSDTTRISIP